MPGYLGVADAVGVGEAVVVGVAAAVGDADAAGAGAVPVEVGVIPVGSGGTITAGGPTFVGS